MLKTEKNISKIIFILTFIHKKVSFKNYIYYNLSYKKQATKIIL